MKSSYKAAWSVIGGINLPSDAQPIELYNSERCRFVLTRDPDNLLADIDRKYAIGMLMMFKGLPSQAELSVVVNAEIEKIKAERKKKMGAWAVLVFEAKEEVDAVIQGQSLEYDEFIVTFDECVHPPVSHDHSLEIEAIKLALAVESEVPSRFVTLSKGTYLINKVGKPVYNMSFPMNGEIVSSIILSEEATCRISARYDLLQQRSDEMKSTQRLFSKMADFENNRLETFLFGWAALEILVAKSFKIYKETFLSSLSNADSSFLHKEFSAQTKDSKNDNYKLTPKFIAVTAVLFSSISYSEAKGDLDKFMGIKKLRDKIYHGEEFSEEDLPIHELAGLLRKYVVAHIDMSN